MYKYNILTIPPYPTSLSILMETPIVKKEIFYCIIWTNDDGTSRMFFCKLE